MSVEIKPRREAPLRINPQSLVLYANYKVGKTSAVAALSDTLLLELQPGGADFCRSAWVQECLTAKALIETLDHLKEQRNAGKPVARRIAVDYLGILDEWLFDLGLAAFLETPQGKPYRPGMEKAVKQVTDIPAAGSNTGSPGWAWYREQLSIMHHKLLMAADEIIYIGHTRDAKVNKEVGEVSYQDIEVSGSKARRLFCGQSSAVGFMFRRQTATEDQLVLTFKTSETVVCGCSCPHLSGKEFVIGRSSNGQPPTFDWSAIYPK